MKTLKSLGQTLPKAQSRATGLPLFDSGVFFMEEIWKDIPETNGRYQASTNGSIRTVKHFTKNRNGLRIVSGGIRKQHIGNKGYFVITICGKKDVVHRIIAKTFIENNENKRTVNHKNGIKTDNRIENLEWATDLENLNHAIRTGLKLFKVGIENKTRREVDRYSVNGAFIDSFISIKSAIKYGRPNHISECCNGKRDSCGGFIWKYKN
jgi:hypothetical protein